MPTWAYILIAVGIVIVLAAVAYMAYQRRRRKELQETFGPEYERAVADSPTRKEAESELVERRKRHDEFDIRPLSPAARDGYTRQWEATQARFVDDPEGAINEADDLIQQVMRERGYPVEDFDQRAADLSVEHGDVVDHYREGHAIARRNIHGDADTEELRQAFKHYKALFEELLESAPERAEA
jgi:hypothetical protein